jgi:DNA-binding MarR family transcriptional regulator
MTDARTFGFLLKDVSRLWKRDFERRAAEIKLGLTLEQCGVLVGVQDNEGINQKVLANLRDTDQMTLVRILDRMEADGWIERRSDPDDRRAWRLYLKPAAKPVLKRIWTVADDVFAEALAGFDNFDDEMLISLLQRVRGNLGALLPGVLEGDAGGVAVKGPTGNRQTGSMSPGKRAPAKGRATGLKAKG